MSAKSSAVPARRAPLLSLWSREDPRTAVIDFLPTKTIATLPFVAKALRDAQSRLLLTAIKRRGKVAVPSPPTTRACLDALLVGEPQFFCEDWERSFPDAPDACQVCHDNAPLARYSYVEQCPDGGYFLELFGSCTPSHRGYALSLRGKNLLVTRLRVTMSYENLVENHDNPEDPGGAVGYVMLCGPGAPTHRGAIGDALDDFMGGPRFNTEGNGVVSLTWLQYVQDGDNVDRMLVENVTPDTPYYVDATFQHESVNSCFGTVDIAVSGQTVVQGLRVAYNPLSSIQLYNWSPGIARIGGIEIWSEKAAPDQVWERED